MSFLAIQKDTQRIGELVVVGSSFSLEKRFITHLCQDVVITNKNMAFGRSILTDDLQLFFYGLGETEQNKQFAWELVAPKMLGYILICNWFDGQEFAQIQKMADELEQSLDAHGIIVGDMGSAPSLPPSVIEEGFSLSKTQTFALWNSSSKWDARNIVRILIDSIIHHME